MNKKFFVYFFLIPIVAAGAVAYFLAKSRVIAPEINVSEDPESATYLIENQSVALVGGRADRGIIPGTATKIQTAIFGIPVYGDLNGDGKNDAAVLLT